MKNPRFSTANGVALSLTNLYYGNRCSVEAIKDAVEDARTAEELKDNLNDLDLFETFGIDRITDTYARLKSKDCWGNTHYFKAEFDEKSILNEADNRKLADYYDEFLDNYIIPFEEMTDKMMSEALDLIKKHPFQNQPHTYLMITYNDGIGDNWCITSWLEEMQ